MSLFFSSHELERVIGEELMLILGGSINLLCSELYLLRLLLSLAFDSGRSG